MLTAYFEEIQQKLQFVLRNEKEKMEFVAHKVVETIQNDGIIQLFGCGHSHVLTEEVFYRAGGLAPVKPILIEPLMLHEGAIRSSLLERQNDYAEKFMKKQDIQKHDLVIVISTSGLNPVPIDVAIHAKKTGAYIVGLSSFAYHDSQPPRHKSGQYLADVVDLPLNNHSKLGDGALQYKDFEVAFGPTSTVIGAAILNGIFAEAIKLMINSGMQPPVFKSGNVVGADDHNKILLNKYSHRIDLLKFNNNHH